MRIKAYLQNLLGPVARMSFTAGPVWVFLNPCISLHPVHRLINSMLYHCHLSRTSFSILASSHPGTSFS